MWYHVSEPNSYLAVTGVGIDNVRITKKCFVMPFQKVTKISITPFDFSMALQAMTSEKLQFSRESPMNHHTMIFADKQHYSACCLHHRTA